MFEYMNTLLTYMVGHTVTPLYMVLNLPRVAWMFPWMFTWKAKTTGQNSRDLKTGSDSKITWEGLP